MYRHGIKTCCKTVLTQSGLPGVTRYVSTSRTRTFQSPSRVPPKDSKCLHTRTSTPAPGQTATAVASEPFLNGHSSSYQEAMYESWLEDPNSVHKSWQTFFSNLEKGAEPGQAYSRPPATTAMYPVSSRQSQAAATQIPIDRMVIEDHLAVQTIIRAYQLRAHNIASLDPLDIAVTPKGQFPSLDPKFYHFGKLLIC